MRLYEGYGSSYTNIDSSISVKKDNTVDEQSKEQIQDSTLLDNRRVEMIRALESQEPGASVKLISHWVEELRLHRTSPAQVYLFVHELLEDLLKWCTTQSVTPPDQLADYHWNQILTLDLQDIEVLLVIMLTDIEEKWHGRIQSKDFVRVQEMIEYMEHHLHLNIGLPGNCGSCSHERVLGEQHVQGRNGDHRLRLFDWITRKKGMHITM